MISERKLEKYVESYYDSEDYSIRCDTEEDFLQVTIQHLNEEPDLAVLVEDLFDTLALRESEWEKLINYDDGHSYAVLNRNEEID